MSTTVSANDIVLLTAAQGLFGLKGGTDDLFCVSSSSENDSMIVSLKIGLSGVFNFLEDASLKGPSTVSLIAGNLGIRFDFGVLTCISLIREHISSSSSENEPNTVSLVLFCCGFGEVNLSLCICGSDEDRRMFPVSSLLDDELSSSLLTTFLGVSGLEFEIFCAFATSEILLLLSSGSESSSEVRT